jgi:hypothetical protein
LIRGLEKHPFEINRILFENDESPSLWLMFSFQMFSCFGKMKSKNQQKKEKSPLVHPVSFKQSEKKSASSKAKHAISEKKSSDLRNSDFITNLLHDSHVNTTSKTKTSVENFKETSDDSHVTSKHVIR